MSSPRFPPLWLPFPLLAIVSTAVALAGCTGSHAIVRNDGVALPGMTWFAPAVPADRSILARWSAGVGPPVVHTARTDGPAAADRLRIISWNIALGSGDVACLLRDVRSEQPDAHIVLLLQEAFREGPEVPGRTHDGIRFAGKLGDGDRRGREIEAIAVAAGLNLYYVPSMRNGSPLVSDEDRGNAILSSLPLSELSAIELPFERQRRVAVAATVSGLTSQGLSWSLRVVSSHLDNLVGPGRGWIFGSTFGRIRQARALVEYLRSDDAVVLGGDFNTWFGFTEGTYAEIARAFPDTKADDRRPTFIGLLRLDHLFFRLPDGWRHRFHRAADRYGSDHYPLVATVDLRSSP